MAATEAAESHQAEETFGQKLSAQQLALARSRAYRLLSQLYLTGVTADNLGLVQAVPELADKLGRPFDADEAAADHHHLFGFNVYPYESLFLDVEGLLGGPVTEGVAQSYRELGYQPTNSTESADHAGFELGLLAFLNAAEAGAWTAGEPDVARQRRERQLAFLEEHLLRWIGPLRLAIGQQDHPFYSALAEVTFDLLQEQAADLYSEFGRLSAKEEPPPPVADLLEDEKTGLKEIANYLLAPVYSGIYLSRDDIGRLARQQSVPRGFGDRRSMLLNLFRAAANYDALGEVVDGLAALTERWEAAYATMIDAPGTGAYAASWRARAAQTAALLTQMLGRIETLS